MGKPTLEVRVAALEDERSILQTLYRYAHSIDSGDESTWVDCFTEDGTFRVDDPRNADPNRVPRMAAGRGELQRLAGSRTRPPEHWHKHLLAEPLIDIDGDEATSAAYFAPLHDYEDRPVISAFGCYLDRLTRCQDGSWRFRERVVEIQSARRGLPSSPL